MLGMCFLFACTCATQQRNFLFLLDEIDAALDENNSALVGKLINTIYKAKQVICISHHPTFQTEVRLFHLSNCQGKTNSSDQQKGRVFLCIENN